MAAHCRTHQRHLGALRRSRGVVLLAFLLALALGGVAALAAADVWSLTRQREREQELLFVGDQYRQAIQRYYFGAPPHTVRVLPMRLDDLLEDDRYPVPVHHLRRRYADPINGGVEWGELRVAGRLAGIHSLSEKTPVKQANFAPGYEQFTGAASYRDWVFAVSPTGEPLSAKQPPNALAQDGAAVPAPNNPPRPSRRFLP
jgi:type II secretory pathway pseudopilin PulG